MTRQALSPQIADKIARIIPRLASTFDHEIVSCAKAIDRTLRRADLDWHDLANCITESGIDRPRPNHRWHPAEDEPVAPLWGELDFNGRVEWLNALDGYHGLTEWEGEFVASIASRQFQSLSHKQVLILNRLISRAFSRGVRP